MLPANNATPSAADLLTEWEQRTSFVPTPTYRQNRPRLLAKLTELWQITAAPADINVDTTDLRMALHSYPSHRLGSAVASGPNRALRLAQAGLADAQTNLLGLMPTAPCVHILQVIESHRVAELEMDELTAITEYLQDAAGNSRTEVVFGYFPQPNLTTELRLHLLLSYGLPLTPPPRPILRPEEIFPAVVRLITERQQVSVNLLQRCLGLCYNRTGRLLEELKAAGVIQRREDSKSKTNSLQGNKGSR